MYKIFVIFLLFSHVFAVAEKGSDNTALVLSFPLSKESKKTLCKTLLSHYALRHSTDHFFYVCAYKIVFTCRSDCRSSIRIFENRTALCENAIRRLGY